MAWKKSIKFGLVFVSGIGVGAVVSVIKTARAITNYKRMYECVYENKESAQHALEKINYILYTYGYATVDEVSEITGVDIDNIRYTAANYGWITPGSFEIVKAGPKYILRASRPVKLEH